ncbi:histidine kinase [Leptospira sp. GIMC2001]|uniref:histidine kinase n=1 Tax=Leptospira sp. GIMC2001 TaxID=1513297 RepID=UPI00234A47F4|nr:histidine kinase [Leptospira sp. GIMC2001]WCL51065.1 histidine kinase [Leptospira sp. GIMC2001]
MAKSFQKLENDIPELVKGSRKFSIRSSRMSSKLEKYVLKVITEILSFVGHDRYVEMLYTITKELAINGVKANQKRVFFEDEGLDIMNAKDYQIGIENYKKKFSEKMAEEYGKRCLARGVFVNIRFHYCEDGMYVEVKNNTPVIKDEEQRMREKMKKAMGYNDIAEFYMDNMDNTEGAGLGIALIMILMKNEDIDPNLFRIITTPSHTIARVEIPFNDKYNSIRNKENMEREKEVA